jgi:AcrR family transcriptional regulator
VATTGTTTRRRKPAVRGQGDALREEILEATSELIAESGDAASVTLRAVARRVGVAATSIYLHFEGIDELLYEAKQCRFTELGEILRDAAESAGSDPAARLRACAHAYARFGMEHEGQYRVMFSSPIRTPVLNPETGVVGSTTFGALVSRVAEFLDVPADDPRAHLLAVHFWTALHGIVHLRTTMRAFAWPDLDEEIDDLMNRLLERRDQ